MKGGVGEFQEAEQRLREYVAFRKAQYAFKAKVEKQRWEQEVLVLEVKEIKRRLLAGGAVDLVLPDMSTPSELSDGR